MDGTPGYTTTLASASKGLYEFVDHTVVSDLAAGSHGASSLYFPNGSKRKCSAFDQPLNLKDGSSLVLGLGLSSNACTAVCSGEEMEDDSVDLGLSLNLIGTNISSNPKKVSAGTFDALKARNPVLDLQLSLSTALTESDVTTDSQRFTPFHNSPSLSSTVEVVDEGSTSSRWKTGSLIPPLQNEEIPIPFDQNHAYGNPNLATPNISSSTSPSLPVSASRPPQRKTSTKACRFEGCTRGARGASGLCIAHGGGRRCQRAGCPKGAEGRTVFCKAHGGGRRCQHLGCTKSAEGRTDYCISHGGGRRCSHEGCPRAARGKSGLCIRHGGGKRCSIENCTKSAEGISGLCISHGGGRRCRYPECTKGAQGSTMLCKAHGGGRRCTFLGCIKGAEGSTPFCKGHGGGKRCTQEGCTKSVHGGTLFCVGHGGGKRCTEPGCTKSARGRTSFCVRHGGGKRCGFGGCTKSAQGSTDFCKAHGGGKRCSWVGVGVVPCDKFARGKTGLCVAHSGQVQEEEMYGLESSVSTQTKGVLSSEQSISYTTGMTLDCGTTSIGSIGFGHQRTSLPIVSFAAVNSCMDSLSLPEGRVHGGSLMAMLRGGTAFSNEEGSGQLESGKSPHRWV